MTERPADLAADRQDWIETGHRLLEDHADVFAAYGTHLDFGQSEEVAFLE
jgi:hypothetical protein